MSDYKDVNGILLPVHGPRSPPPTKLELAVAEAVLRTFGGPMLVEANVGRGKAFMDALADVGFLVAPKTHQQEPEQSGSK